MTKIKMHLHEAPYRAIERGEKTVERRLNDEKRRGLKVGDVIEFSLVGGGPEDVFKRTIAGLHVFPTFAEMFVAFPAEPADSLEAMYEYYTKEDEAKLGVVAIVLGEN